MRMTVGIIPSSALALQSPLHLVGVGFVASLCGVDHSCFIACLADGLNHGLRVRLSAGQRTAARFCSNETSALPTSRTPPMAFLTYRAQLLHVIPFTASSMWVACRQSRSSLVCLHGLHSGTVKVFNRTEPGVRLSCATKHQNEFEPN